ncbi:hypothetical protein HK413_07460 [Mucilaginibacter sp. S1162]|uniref:Uncharacterized protein n=1 Tax=Mucilaginibacter humi TaxID=2732510 RepID=A0ABX1W1C0_9SPHI|nr:hypothetical protein [Mucilaginibacter humi]NNU34029.1 hypothetical protein [Mucilaginibacter humi]
MIQSSLSSALIAPPVKVNAVALNDQLFAEFNMLYVPRVDAVVAIEVTVPSAATLSRARFFIARVGCAATASFWLCT